MGGYFDRIYTNAIEVSINLSVKEFIYIYIQYIELLVRYDILFCILYFINFFVCSY